MTCSVRGPFVIVPMPADPENQGAFRLLGMEGPNRKLAAAGNLKSLGVAADIVLFGHPFSARKSGLTTLPPSQTSDDWSAQ